MNELLPNRVMTPDAKGMDLNTVMIGRPLAINAATLVMIGFGQVPDSTRFYIGSDPSTKRHTNVLLFRSKLYRSPICHRASKV